MEHDLVTELMPTLTRQWEDRRFNLFDVLRHGTHEKQLSNLFAWLLTNDETHELGDMPARIFVDEINAVRPGKPINCGRFKVFQEENTSDPSLGADIADIVLVDEDERVAIVVENFHTSNGHGHSYASYLKHGQRRIGEGTSIVVLLCATEDRTQLEGGWEESAVITYRNFVRKVCDHVDSTNDYAVHRPEQAAFFKQMRAHFVKGEEVNDQASIEFVRQMCVVDEAELFGRSNQAVVEEAFAEKLKQESLRRIGEGRDMLLRVKSELKLFCSGPLRSMVQEISGREVFDDVKADWRGSYQWSVRLMKGGLGNDNEILRIRFGPTAWYAFKDPYGEFPNLDRSQQNPDFAYLFVGDPFTTRMQQTSVTLGDVLGGLDGDTRLAEEIVAFLNEAENV